MIKKKPKVLQRHLRFFIESLSNSGYDGSNTRRVAQEVAQVEELTFVCSAEVLVQFPDLKVKETAKADVPFTLQVIDAPFALEYTPTATHWKLRARTRGMWPAMQPAMLTMHKETGLVDLSREEAAAYLPIYFNLCRNLSAYAEEQGWQTTKGEAICLNLDESGLITQTVAGDERPLLMGVTLAGAYVAEYANWALVDVQAQGLDALIQCAEHGDEASMQALIALYTYGNATVPKDAVALFRWQRILAQAGDERAAYALALQYAHGYGVKRNFKAAAEWMEKAGAQDQAHAFWQNNADAMRAEAGDAHAQAQLAATLLLQAGKLDGATLEDDYREAVHWAEKAAEVEEGLGLWILAQAYENGLGVNADLEYALACYEKGAQLGQTDCQVGLAEHYLYGDVCIPDEAKAFGLAKEAAQTGNTHAMRLTADCYMNGIGTQQDKPQALYWYRQVAKQISDPAVEEAIEYLTR